MCVLRDHPALVVADIQAQGVQEGNELRNDTKQGVLQIDLWRVLRRGRDLAARLSLEELRQLLCAALEDGQHFIEALDFWRLGDTTILE